MPAPQIAREDQRPLARKLAAEFQKAGLRVRGVELRSDNSPESTELRIQGRSDRALARWIAVRASAAGLTTQPVNLLKNDPDVDTYELWIGKTVGQGLSVGQRFRDCPDDSCPWLRVLPAEEFMMGSAEDEEGHRPNESPQHGVRISQPFAVMEAEVTREAFERFVKDAAYEVGESCHTRYENGARSNVKRDWLRPGFEQGPNHPVVCVDWNGATAFAAWLTKRTRQTYRLLTEAEWEYAARARTRSTYHFGDQSSDLCRYANVTTAVRKRWIHV